MSPSAPAPASGSGAAPDSSLTPPLKAGSRHMYNFSIAELEALKSLFANTDTGRGLSLGLGPVKRNDEAAVDALYEWFLDHALERRNRGPDMATVHKLYVQERGAPAEAGAGAGAGDGAGAGVAPAAPVREDGVEAVLARFAAGRGYVGDFAAEHNDLSDERPDEWIPAWQFAVSVLDLAIRHAGEMVCRDKEEEEERKRRRMEKSVVRWDRFRVRCVVGNGGGSGMREFYVRVPGPLN